MGLQFILKHIFFQVLNFEFYKRLKKKQFIEHTAEVKKQKEKKHSLTLFKQTPDISQNLQLPKVKFLKLQQLTVLEM